MTSCEILSYKGICQLSALLSYIKCVKTAKPQNQKYLSDTNVTNEVPIHDFLFNDNTLITLHLIVLEIAMDPQFQDPNSQLYLSSLSLNTRKWSRIINRYNETGSVFDKQRNGRLRYIVTSGLNHQSWVSLEVSTSYLNWYSPDLTSEISI